MVRIAPAMPIMKMKMKNINLGHRAQYKKCSCSKAHCSSKKLAQSSPLLTHSSRLRAKSYTLLELVIVTTLLAIIAGSAVISATSGQTAIKMDLVEHRASIIYQALERFRSDMGHYPKAIGALDFDNGINPCPIELTADTIEQENWFKNTGNFNQLFERPVSNGSNEDKWLWSVDYKTGWNGPYINEGDFTVDDETDSNLFNGSTTDRPFVISKDTIATQSGIKADNLSDNSPEVFFQLIEEEIPENSNRYIYKLQYTLIDEDGNEFTKSKQLTRTRIYVAP